MNQLLFTYGTLRLAAVQRAVFGRQLCTGADALVGYVLADIEITDPDVIAVSGTATHSMLCPSPNPMDTVYGLVLGVDDRDLAAADAYEVDAYQRVVVTLRSGRTAWAYTRANRFVAEPFGF